jgi:hypothetical protein
VSTLKSLELICRGSVLWRILDRAPTYLADLRENPRWLVMFLFARTTAGRYYGQHRRAQATGGARDTCPTMFGAERASLVAALRESGLTCGLCLPDRITWSIRDFTETTACFGNHDRRHDLQPAQHLATHGNYDPFTSGHCFERIAGCPAISAVAQDALLHGVARDYLGPRAQLISTRLWWSFPVSRSNGTVSPRQREMLHFDLDDWRMLKFFFYVTPVDMDTGPHLYVRGSHRRHILRHQLSLTVGRPYDEVLTAYGSDGLIPILGPAGTGFAEDPYGFHVGSLPRTAPRLMLEIGFGITPPGRRRFFGERAGSIMGGRTAAPAREPHYPAIGSTVSQRDWPS